LKADSIRSVARDLPIIIGQVYLNHAAHLFIRFLNRAV
jgi:hypothetical protein